METTAEGIETLDQLSLIRDLRVSHVQGYIYSQPVNNETLLANCSVGDWTIEPTGPAVQRSDRYAMFRKIAAITTIIATTLLGAYRGRRALDRHL